MFLSRLQASFISFSHSRTFRHKNLPQRLVFSRVFWRKQLFLEMCVCVCECLWFSTKSCLQKPPRAVSFLVRLQCDFVCVWKCVCCYVSLRTLTFTMLLFCFHLVNKLKLVSFFFFLCGISVKAEDVWISSHVFTYIRFIRCHRFCVYTIRKSDAIVFHHAMSRHCYFWQMQSANATIWITGYKPKLHTIEREAKKHTHAHCRVFSWSEIVIWEKPLFYAPLQ